MPNDEWTMDIKVTHGPLCAALEIKMKNVNNSIDVLEREDSTSLKEEFLGNFMMPQDAFEPVWVAHDTNFSGFIGKTNLDQRESLPERIDLILPDPPKMCNEHGKLIYGAKMLDWMKWRTLYVSIRT